MKTTFFTLTLVFCLTTAFAQEKNSGKATAKESQKKEMNLMDEQAKLFGTLFGDMEEDLDGTKDPFKDVKSYEDLLKKSTMDPETKSKMRAMYLLYDQSLDPKQKDSLKVSLEKMFAESTNQPKKQN